MGRHTIHDARWGELATSRGRRASVGRWTLLAIRYLVLIGASVVFLFPFYLIVRNALMTQPEITAFDWVWWPEAMQWRNFADLFRNTEIDMATGLRNSAILAGVNLIFQTLFASMAGYALARIPFRGKGVGFAVILFALMVPNAMTFVPTYVVVAWLGGINTLWGIVLPGLFSAFATFLFRQFYLGFPSEIEEAARLDGSSYLGVYWRMVLPNSMGIMAALGTISVIGSWNAFLWPVVVGQRSDTQTVQVVLSSFLTAQTINLPALFAGAIVGAVPLVVVFLLLQRSIVQGVRMSGIKG